MKSEQPVHLLKSEIKGESGSAGHRSAQLWRPPGSRWAQLSSATVSQEAVPVRRRKGREGRRGEERREGEKGEKEEQEGKAGWKREVREEKKGGRRGFTCQHLKEMIGDRLSCLGNGMLPHARDQVYILLKDTLLIYTFPSDYEACSAFHGSIPE